LLRPDLTEDSSCYYRWYYSTDKSATISIDRNNQQETISKMDQPAMWAWCTFLKLW